MSVSCYQDITVAVTQEIAYLEPVQLARQLADHAAVDRQALYRTMYPSDHDGTAWGGAVGAGQD